jgi:hypothetical protein
MNEAQLFNVQGDSSGLMNGPPAWRRLRTMEFAVSPLEKYHIAVFAGVQKTQK